MLGPYQLNTIVTGDARELAKAVPDESVDLIFTDPLYDRIDDYRWLAETAARVLKPDGHLLVWSNGRWHYQNTRWLDDSPLNYMWTFTTINNNQSAPMNGKIICKSNRIIWFGKGVDRNMRGYIPDGVLVIGGSDIMPNRGGWSWGKYAKSHRRYIEALTDSGDIVLDTFAGSGSICAASKVSNRRYLGFEIDATRAAAASWALERTTPPLPMPIATQGALL